MENMSYTTQSSDIPDIYTVSQINNDPQDDLTAQQLKELSENTVEEKKKPLLLWIKKSTFSLTKGVRKKDLHVLVNVKENLSVPLDLNDQENVKPVNTSLLSITKRIIDSKAYSKILSHDAGTLGYVKSCSLPGTNKKGLYMVDIADALSIQEWLDERIKQRELLVKEFAVDNYDDIIKEMSVKLGPLFSYNDYPSSEKIKNCFNFIYKFFNFDVPLSLRDVSLSLYNKEKQRSEQYWEKLRKSIRSGLVSSYKGLIDNFIQNLSPAEDGKRKKFSKKSVDKMMDFINNFDSKNSFADFNELQVLVNESRQLMMGIDVENLKKDEDLGKYLSQSFNDISNKMSEFVELEEERVYEFEEENE